MAKSIRHVGVIGSGVMGSGIAAHLANAGVLVTMLDVVPGAGTNATKAGSRDQLAIEALDKVQKSKPALFFHRSVSRLISVGNLEDDLERLKTCDLVIEAVLERLEVKQALFAKLEEILPKHVVVASNTSGLRIEEMLAGRGEEFKKNFLVMHFFNPVRYMKLLEIVVGRETSQEVKKRMATFGENVLGKGIVWGKDTPNFVGNRIGIHGMMATIQIMMEMELTPEDVDAITGKPMAHPGSATFRTADMVGIDTFVHVADHCYHSLLHDEERAIFKVPSFVRQMVQERYLGNKTRGGFYKKTPEGIFTYDPFSLRYREKKGDETIKSVCKKIAKLEDPAERIKALIADPGKAGEFAWKVISRTLAYSARRVGEIADHMTAIDDAMKWGYNWELGPFEIWDALGFDYVFSRMEKDGTPIAESIKKMKMMAKTGEPKFYAKENKLFDLVKGEYTPRFVDPRCASFHILKRGEAPVLKNDGAEAWDLGDGVLGFQFKTKANSIDPDVISMLSKAVEKAEEDFRGMLISNEGEHFCVGANLFLVLMAAGQHQWEQIRKMVRDYQNATQHLKYASVPVVAAPYGMTLGGGLELCFGCDVVQAAAETYSGLVEVSVGLLPGGGGNLNMLWRSLENIPEGTQAIVQEYVIQTFKNIALAKVATSAQEGKAFGYFRQTDGVSFDKARLVTEAKARLIGLAESGYHPPTPKAYVLPGESGIATLSMMVDTLVAGAYASLHDAKIARKIAEVLCGGRGGSSREVTEEQMLELEAEAFVSLVGEPKSQERMQYMLMNNKPLRN